VFAFPSRPATRFLRRAYLDVIGTLPTSEEARAFLKDERPDKRARLVDGILHAPSSPISGPYMADVLRVDRQALGTSGRMPYRWIRETGGERPV